MQFIEKLEDRRLLTSFTASSVAELIADINASNAAGGSNTITLNAGTAFKLTTVDNNVDGANGLPAIAAGNDLTVVGNGDIIQRSGSSKALFRLFDVAPGASLALNDLTVSNGWSAQNGGAIFSEGTLSLSHVTVQNSTIGAPQQYSAQGGGIYSAGVLTIADSTIRNNQAIAGDGFDQGILSGPWPGAPAYGGGLYISGGTATIANSTFSSNLVQGGKGGDGGKLTGGFVTGQWSAGASGGNAFGGAIYIASGTVTIQGTTITSNTATGGLPGNSHKGAIFGPPSNGAGAGGGIYIFSASIATVSLDSFTVAHTSGNTASTSDNDIFGSFIVLG